MKPRKVAKGIFVFYVEDSSPKIKRFKKLDVAKFWVDAFTKINPNEDDGYWVDQIVIGEVLLFNGEL